MILGITGSRKIPDLKERVKTTISSLNPEKIISGMALGSDLLCVEIAIELNIPFIAAVPFINQEKLWNEQDKVRYQEFLNKAEKVVIVSDGEFANWKYQKRNEWIVDNCDVILGITAEDNNSGGTYNCLKYAEKVNRKIIKLTF